jgi:hypothetical protein
MKLITITGAILLAGNALAAPGTALRRERALQKRARSGHQTKPLISVDGPVALKTNNTNVEYSGNWAGAVLIGTGYTSVTGTFTVPTPSTDGSGSVRTPCLGIPSATPFFI